MRYLLVLIGLVAFSCQAPEEHAHTDGEHGGHSHAGDGKPAMDFTIWTDQTELFVEFPALVVGETSRFAAHFTVLNGHQPVREGSVTASLIKGDKGIRHTVEAPSSPGIFTPALQPNEPGVYQLVFELKTAAYSDKIILKNVTVFATAEEAEMVLGGNEEDGNSITFLIWEIRFPKTGAPFSFSICCWIFCPILLTSIFNK